MSKKLLWRVNTAALLKEVLNNPGTSALVRPLQVLASIIVEVGERASELNDPELNALMCRLAIYSVADQYSPDHNIKIVNKTLARGRTARRKKGKPVYY